MTPNITDRIFGACQTIDEARADLDLLAHAFDITGNRRVADRLTELAREIDAKLTEIKQAWLDANQPPRTETA